MYGPFTTDLYGSWHNLLEYFRLNDSTPSFRLDIQVMGLITETALAYIPFSELHHRELLPFLFPLQETREIRN